MEGDNVRWSDVVKRLDATQFKRTHESIHDYDLVGHTALYAASFCERVEWVRYLIDSKCDVNQRTNPGKDTPLITALQDPDNMTIVKMLLEAKSDVNAVNDHGVTPLSQSLTFWGKLETVDLLLKHGADVNLNNPLDAITRYNDYNKEVAKILISLGGLFSPDDEVFRPRDLILFTKCLANCKVAMRCVERVIIKRYGKLHKDIAPIIASLVWETKEDEKWLL
jgi:hypothetical protein